jgi:SAM-dependent methyltransferase
MYEEITTFKYFLDRTSYLNWLGSAATQHARRLSEAQTLATLSAGRDVSLYCHAHRGFATLRYSIRGVHTDGYNWREFGQCSQCDSITRIRLVAECIRRTSLNYVKPIVYLTEQLTPLYKLLRTQYVGLLGSEFVPEPSLRDRAQMRLRSYLGDEQARLRHEDGCALTFASESINLIGSFDVLEHIPDYRKALREFFRVLTPGGQLFLTAPFLPASEETLVRARLTGEVTRPVEHLEPPEYHGNPTDPEGGTLCFYHFGWNLLHELRSEGFRAVALMESWSNETAIFGNQQVIVATK